ncbi:MAG: hypothetical protein FD159_2760, partial [Syntrophaceae bacterium]
LSRLKIRLNEQVFAPGQMISPFLKGAWSLALLGGLF